MRDGNPARLFGSAFLGPAAVVLVACGPTTPAGAPILAPAGFTLTVRGLAVTLDPSGAVHAPGCDAHLDFARASLERDGATLARLEGDAWPRALVVGSGAPPVTVDATHVASNGETLYAISGGVLVDGGGGVTPAPALVATDLGEDEATTALALLALLPACWEGAPLTAGTR